MKKATKSMKMSYGQAPAKGSTAKASKKDKMMMSKEAKKGSMPMPAPKKKA
jgi:hypothetical protein